MIKFDKTSYILGMWFSHDKDGHDWMCFVQRPKDSQEWKGQYRTRTRKDEKIYGSDDEKHWYSFRAKDKKENEIIKIVDGIQNAGKLIYPFVDKLMIQGDLAMFLEKAKNANKDWLNIRTMEVHQGGKK